ncbi:hypothetical protein L7F22_050211 [Adiantum nelumboides]|nr:hypothetical protein [Adiantum nelumboides]
MASAGGGRGRGGFGGGRGGRGGRGGGGGGGSGGVHALPMGALTWNDFAEADKAKPNRHAYPPMEEQPVVRKPNERETRIIARQLAFIEAQRQTPWWIRPLDSNGQFKQQSTSANAAANSAAGGNAPSGVPAPSAGAASGVKRSSAYLPRYSDKFRRINGLSNGNDADHTLSSSNDLDSLTLQDEALLNMLQKEAFPNGLWRTYVEGESKRHEKRQEAVANAKKRRSDWRKIVTGVELAGNDDISDGAHSDDDVGEDAYQDEYEDDVEDDYADNYFDNGEDDDLPDEGGAGEADDAYD